MQLSMFDHPATTPKKVPTIVVRGVNSDYIAIRFRQIGNPQKRSEKHQDAKRRIMRRVIAM